MQKGRNKLLIKSETSGQPWVVYLKMNIDKNKPTLGLTGTPFISEELAGLSNWLIVGPFENSTAQRQTYRSGNDLCTGTCF